MIARSKSTLTLLLLLATGLPGGLGVGMHALAPVRRDAVGCPHDVQLLS